MAQMTPAARAAPPIIQIGSIPAATTGAGAGGPASSGAGAAASGAGAVEVAPPEVAPPDDAAPPDVPAPPLSPCAKPMPVVENNNAPPVRTDTHLRCMTFFSR